MESNLEPSHIPIATTCYLRISCIAILTLGFNLEFPNVFHLSEQKQTSSLPHLIITNTHKLKGVLLSVLTLSSDKQRKH